MSFHQNQLSSSGITSFQEFIRHADYSLRTNLNPDPASSHDGDDHRAREVCSGHYVPVNPTPLPDPIYITHSYHLFKDLGLHDVLVEDQNFIKMFSGDIGTIETARCVGWATGYALSIYGTESVSYTHLTLPTKA